jgi:hypothetical protein
MLQRKQFCLQNQGVTFQVGLGECNLLEEDQQLSTPHPLQELGVNLSEGQSEGRSGFQSLSKF